MNGWRDFNKENEPDIGVKVVTIWLNGVVSQGIYSGNFIVNGSSQPDGTQWLYAPDLQCDFTSVIGGVEVEYRHGVLRFNHMKQQSLVRTVMLALLKKDAEE